MKFFSIVFTLNTIEQFVTIGLTNLKLQQVHTGGIVQDTHISY